MADAEGQWQTRADNGSRERTLADADGHWQTRAEMADEGGH